MQTLTVYLARVLLCHQCECGSLKVHQILHRTDWRNCQMTNIPSLSYPAFPSFLVVTIPNICHQGTDSTIFFLKAEFQLSLLYNWSLFPPLHFNKVFIPTGESNLPLHYRLPCFWRGRQFTTGTDSNNYLSIDIGLTQNVPVCIQKSCNISWLLALQTCISCSDSMAED